jgi:uncharacterized membrane-anchored protein
MGAHVWQWIATAPASLMAGVALVLLLVFCDGHRDDENQRISAQKLVAVFLGGLSAYTLLMLVIGHFFLNIPISEDISSSFGDSRVAWLFVGVTADVMARVYSLFS